MLPGNLIQYGWHLDQFNQRPRKLGGWSAVYNIMVTTSTSWKTTNRPRQSR
jgi:hypothetical protein